MDNHPIPQDVTGFKFKLIGSMTIKQFLYLLGFGILATISFVLPLSPFIKYPFVVIFAAIGTALAFLPVEGRPLDVMITNFAKTIPSENRFIFKKRGANLASFGIFETPAQTKATTATHAATAATAVRDSNSDKRAALVSRLRSANFKPEESETQTLSNIHMLLDGKNPAVAPPGEVVEKKADPANEKKPAGINASIQEQAKIGIHENKTIDLTDKKVQETIKFAGEQSHEMPADIAAPAVVAQKPNPTLSIGFPVLPDIGNVILGMVRDPRNKNLPNVIVEVIDGNGIPVRAFKTNTLGQFAAATPLPNGSYKIHFEDPAKLHEFKDAEATLSGEIFQPLEITSIDAREKLRQELFGGVAAAA